MAFDALRSTFRRPGATPGDVQADTAGAIALPSPSQAAPSPLDTSRSSAQAPSDDDGDTEALTRPDWATDTLAGSPAVAPAERTYAAMPAWSLPSVERALPGASATVAPAPTAEPAFGLPVRPIAGATADIGSGTAGEATTGDASGPIADDPTVGFDTDGGAFGCPSCGRTLTRGTLRCQGCGQWLVLDVPLRRAAMLSGGGLVAGILVTLLLVNVFAPPAARVADPAAAGAAANAAAGASAVVPSAAIAALRGTTAINGRLAAEATPLRKELDAKSFDTGEVVKILRRMAIDARAGAGMVGILAGWPEAAGDQAALGAFYEDLGSRIDDGLTASVRSAGAYKKTAKAVLSTLERIPDLDADARTLAGRAGIELAPISIPQSLR